MGNVMVIPAKRQVGNTARQLDASLNSESRRTVELVLTAMSRQQAMKLRSSIYTECMWANMDEPIYISPEDAAFEQRV